ncbi:MAG: hypothetical protein WC223_06330 [Bacteroidales bacterium]|jgi:hypothetical protein
MSSNKILIKEKTIVKPIGLTVTSTEDAPVTMLYCRYTTSPKYNCGWWVNIYKTCILQDTISGKSIKMITAINIPYAPSKHFLKKLGDSLTFILVFPRIPKDWVVFDFIEGRSEDSLSSHGILRNDSGIYRIQVS